MALFIPQLREQDVHSMQGCLNPREGQNVLWCWIFLHIFFFLLSSYLLGAWLRLSLYAYTNICVSVRALLFLWWLCCHGSCDPSSGCPQPPAVLGSLLILNWQKFTESNGICTRKKTDLCPQCCIPLPPLLYDMSMPLPPFHSPTKSSCSGVLENGSEVSFSLGHHPLWLHLRHHLFEGLKPRTSKATSFGSSVL